MKKSLFILLVLLAVQAFAATNDFGFAPATQSVPGIYLDSHSDRCSQKQYKLDGGPISITFDYKVICNQNQNISRSAVFVLLNGNPIFKVTPRDSGRNIKLDGTLPAGTYVLSFCTLGDANEPQHQAFISSITVSVKQCEGAFGKDLIVNGGFQQNSCTCDWCIWDICTFKPNSLPGWKADNLVEIGKNNLYARPSIGTGFVALIEGARKMFLRQKLSLTAGKYSLQFDWASRYLTIAGVNSFEVKYNGVCLKSIPLVVDGCRSEKIEFNIDEDVTDGQLVFSIDGLTCYGVLLDNVKLKKFDTCATSKTVQL